MLTGIVKTFIELSKNLSVAVIGETIIDEFVYVTYEGQSMKSICPVLRHVSKNATQQGGAAAIANHMRNFVKSVDVFTNGESEIVKTRYIDINDGKKHVEINRIDLKEVGPPAVNVADYDVVIVADFGHGFCNDLTINDGFHLMCQTNSNNFGFNRVSKWRNWRKKSVCIDLREASLQLNRKIDFRKRDEIVKLFNYELNSENLYLTLGSNGSIHFNGSDLIQQGSFKSQIVDTIGAGDTYFAFAALATEVCYDRNLLLVPSLAASLSTTWLCNEKSVSRDSLIEYAGRFV